MRFPFPIKILLVLGVVWQASINCGFALTLEASLTYAMQHAEAARMAELQQQAGQYAARGGTAFTRPQITAQGRYLEMATNYETSPIVIPLPEGEVRLDTDFLAPAEKEMGGTLKLSQLLFSGGRITGSRELETVRIHQAALLKALQLRELRYQVRTAYDAVLYQRAIREIQKERLKMRTVEREDALALWEAGMVTRLDVRQADLNFNLAEDALRRTEAALEKAVVQFNTVLGRHSSETPFLPEGTLTPLADLPTLLDRTAAAIESGAVLEIRQAQDEVRNARLQHKVAGGGYWPQLALVSSVASQGEGFGDLYESAAVGVQVEWMIFDGGLVDSRCGATRAEFHRALKGLQRVKKQISGKLAELRVSQHSLAQRAGLQRKTVALAQENYEDARGQYRAGTITLTRLGDFNLAHTEAQFQLQRIYFEQRQIHHQTTSVLENEALR